MAKKKKRASQANNLAGVAVIVAVGAIAIGLFIEQQLRPYRIFYVFTSRERGWRDQAFEVAMYSAVAAAVLLVASRAIRKM